MINVLLAEDSQTTRRLLREILAADKAIKIVGEAENGLEAVQLAAELKPQVILMDLVMPMMSGLQATERIMRECPTAIIVISSNQEVRQTEICMTALRAGALAVLTKPIGPNSDDFVAKSQHLIATIKAMSQVSPRAMTQSAVRKPKEISTADSAEQTVQYAPIRRLTTVKVIAITASIGGPNALETILRELPADFPVPLLVVQHMAKGFMESLTQWLDRASPINVKVAGAREPLLPGTVYFAPDDCHLGVSPDDCVLLASGPAIKGFRPSGTFLFESTAKVYGAGTLAVILTGMGDDGVQGLGAVRDRGGTVIAQDQETSIVFGMPGKAIANKLVDVVLPLDRIAAQLLELV